jgi:hypothetical protein
MIIVSESSAKATQPVRADRYTPTRHSSSTPRDDTLSYADVRLISVHTEVFVGIVPIGGVRSRSRGNPDRKSTIFTFIYAKQAQYTLVCADRDRLR